MDTDMIKSDSLVFEYKRYNEETAQNESMTALNNINVTIKKGEFVAILGHNGSGKSTLAKHMNAILAPTSGTIWVNGYDSKSPEDIWNIRQSAGMIFQNPDNQIVATIVEEDVAFGPENLGVPPEEIRRRVDESLETVGMTEYAQLSPHYLSGGQKQRIAIAGILAMRPACIVLDEPTAMLDPIGRREVIDTIMMLNKEAGITIILITHYMEEAVLADRVVVMENGGIVMEGVPKEIFRQFEKMKAIGLDVPQVTEVCHRLRGLGVDISDDLLSIDEMVGALCQLK